MMTTTTINLETTTVPVKTEDQSWDEFAQAIQAAEEAEGTRLMTAIPTPEITAECGTAAWGKEWEAQREAGRKRDDLMAQFSSRLVLEVGKTIAAATPNFRTFEVQYCGEGDSGEACEIFVNIDNRHRSKDADGNYRLPTQEERDAFDREYREANSILPEALTEWLDETCWMIAYNRHPGFEIDCGGYGVIIVQPVDEDDPASPFQITISHTQRIEKEYEEEVLV